MTPLQEEDVAIKRILTETRRIALVGASNRPNRPSYEVMQFLLAQGYDVTPVNPGLAGLLIHNQRVVTTLEEAAPLDMVDLFRDPADLEDDVTEAIRLGAKTIWMQIGVINQRSAIEGRNAGLNVIMNRCPKIEIPRLGIPRPDLTKPRP
jgi:predicted CoA-binding protein